MGATVLAFGAATDQGVLNDANAGRGWIAPTALAEPGGTWSISSYELFLISIGYAVSDQLSISATTIPPRATPVARCRSSVRPRWSRASGSG